MAEITVFLAIQKIGLAVTAEAQRLISSKLPSEVELITQVPSSIKRIQREFLVMQAFLSNIDSYKKNAALQAWLQELRKIANEVEDVVDKFIYQLDDDRWNGVSGLFKKITGRPQKFLEWRDIASKLKELESDLQHVTQIKDRWIKMESVTGSLANATEMQLEDSLDFVDDGEPVGIDENMKKLEKMLLTQENSSSNNDSLFSSSAGNNRSIHWSENRSIRQQQVGGFWAINRQGAKNQYEIKPVQPAQIIAVFGQSGVGKSFLVSKFYNNVKSRFDLHALVHAPLGDNLEDLAKSLIKKLKRKDVYRGDNDNTLRCELLKRILDKKKYLIILEDVCETLYDQIKRILVSEVAGCRVIITTDSKDIARHVDKQFQVEVKPLNHKQAMALLIRMAFPKENLTRCPKELETSADNIIEQCGYLPSVIVSVGVLLSQKERVMSEWENVSEQFGWHVENNQKLSRPKIAFELSLKGLRNSRKNCYLFCSMFPKDFVFRRKRLIRIWVAEGFVEQRGNSSMEEVAEEHLNKLVNLCMFEVVDRNIHGRVKRFKLQAFKHEILMSISKRDQFCMLWTDQEKVYHSNEIRHLCLYKYRMNSGSDIVMPRLRSFLVREGDISDHLLSSMLSNSHFLMVLDLQKTGISKIPESIGELFNLQYLNLRQTKKRSYLRPWGGLPSCRRWTSSRLI